MFELSSQWDLRVLNSHATSINFSGTFTEIRKFIKIAHPLSELPVLCFVDVPQDLLGPQKSVLRTPNIRMKVVCVLREILVEEFVGVVLRVSQNHVLAITVHPGIVSRTMAMVG